MLGGIQGQNAACAVTIEERKRHGRRTAFPHDDAYSTAHDVRLTTATKPGSTPVAVISERLARRFTSGMRIRWLAHHACGREARMQIPAGRLNRDPGRVYGEGAGEGRDAALGCRIARVAGLATCASWLPTRTMEPLPALIMRSASRAIRMTCSSG